MKRNVVQQGTTTLMVSLPIKWVKKYNIKKGEELEVSENGRKLIISTESQIERTAVEVNLLDNNPIYMYRIVSYAYLNGYDEIKINFTHFKQLEIIQKSVEKFFLGFEIIEQKKNYCIIRNSIRL